MSCKVELHIDGYVFPIKKMRWGFSQGTNPNGNPSNKIRQKMMYFDIDMIRDDLFEAWAYANFMKKDFEIHIIPNILGSGRTRINKYFEAFLVEFTTEFDHHNKEQTTHRCVVTYGRFETNTSTAVFRENWAQKPLPAGTVVHSSAVEEEKKEAFKQLFYENSDGQRVEKLKKNTKVNFVVTSENMTGKYVDIDLSGDGCNFEYKGNILSDDQLENIKITADIMRIPLITRKQN